MARITVEDCIDKFTNRFELVLVASNRARKLHSGEVSKIEKDNDKNTVIALREIADESLTIDQLKNNLIEEYQTVSKYDEEEENLEIANEEESSSLETANKESNSSKNSDELESDNIINEVTEVDKNADLDLEKNSIKDDDDGDEALKQENNEDANSILDNKIENQNFE
tara:strand:- start:8330 stop:8836 length:507 start_codon:yes stop_codon:yes gene_type:complete